MSDIDDLSFEILDSVPTDSYTGNSGRFNSSVKTGPVSGSPFIESEMTRMRLSARQSPQPSASPFNQNKENRQDVALDILLRRKTPSAELMVSGWVGDIDN